MSPAIPGSLSSPDAASGTPGAGRRSQPAGLQPPFPGPQTDCIIEIQVNTSNGNNLFDVQCRLNMFGINPKSGLQWPCMSRSPITACCLKWQDTNTRFQTVSIYSICDVPWGHATMPYVLLLHEYCSAYEQLKFPLNHAANFPWRKPCSCCI